MGALDPPGSWRERLTEMQSTLIRRQYDEIIASHYDFDPQSMIGDSLDRALGQVERQLGENGSLKVLDVGVGTGRFVEKLRASRAVEPMGSTSRRR